MNFLNKMERKLGRFAIHNLIIYILACYVIGYALFFIQPTLFSEINLEPLLILQGQVWRLFSWVLIPPSAISIFTILMIFFYYFAGRSLERAWGAFRFNVYIFSGLIFTVIGAFLLFFLTGEPVLMGGLFNTSYINTSLLLAFAATFPNQQVRLYMVLPIRVKWLGVIFAIPLVYELIVGSMVSRVAIISSLLNFLIFFYFTMRPTLYRMSPKEQMRRNSFAKAHRSKEDKTGNQPGHKCAVCGRTDVDHPELEFRYCSKCKGNMEYCQDHLFTHVHKE